MQILIRKVGYAADLAWKYFATARSSRKNAPLFENVETYCTFLGFSRSGHTLVASLLDSHPEAVIAQELGDLKHLRFGFDRLRLYEIIRRNTRARAAARRQTRGYFYDVPGQWQGRFQQIRVIGDQQAEGFTRRLHDHPHLLQRLRDVVGTPIRVIQMVRNPFDNITTLATRAAAQSYLRAVGFSSEVEGCVEPYFSLCESVMRVRRDLAADELIEIRHESFVADPRACLQHLCVTLNLEPTEEYLDACTGIVFKSPRKTRHDREWSPTLREEVARRMKAFPFLDGYTFDD